MPKESSAVMRFIDLVNQKPLIDPLEEPSAFAEPSSSFPLPEPNGKRPLLPKPTRTARASQPPPIPSLALPKQSMDTQIVNTLPGSPKRSKVWYALGAVCFLGLGVAIGVLANRGGSADAAGASASKAATANQAVGAPTDNAKTNTPPPAAKPPTPTVAGAAPITDGETRAEASTTPDAVTDPAVLKKTGFDIRVKPEGATIRLDGKDIGSSSLRVRNLKSGSHTLEVVAPEGYASIKKDVELGAGEVKELNIELVKQKVALPETIVASFTSEPPGATVTLYTNDQKLISKTTPIKMKLRTGHEYRAEFARKGYKTITKQLEINDGSELKVAAVLETSKKAAPVRVKMRRAKRRARRARAIKRRRARTARRSRKARVAKGYGTLLVGSKPPCVIYIDGRPTGKMTPDRIRVKAGKHRVSLINRKYGIRRTVRVRVRSGKRTRVIRDFSSKMR